MDKSREARRPAMAASNGLLKRRSRSSAMRDSLDDGHAARQHGPSLVDRVEKRDRDRDSLNRTKRRRSDRILQKNEREEEGEASSDDSFSADDETPQNTASSQGIHRKSLPLPCVSRTFKVAEEMIGVPVPRKARSACVKRSNECRTSSASVSPASQSFEAGSPSSSNVSVKQKMKSNGSKNRQSKQSLKSSISAQNDLEIEIAEVLSGLKQSQSSKKEDETENSVNLIEQKDMITPNHNPNSSPIDSRKAKVKCEDSSDLMKNSSNASAVNAETPRPAQMESSASKTMETEKSNVQMKQETPKLSMEEAFCLRDGSENKENFDSKDSTLIKGKSGGSEFKSQREDNNNDKFKIDLMAPPFNSMSLSPERDAFVPPSDFKPTAQNSDRKENLFKDEKVTTEASREKKENGKWFKLDLEMPMQNDHKDCSLKLLNQGQKQPQEQQFAKAFVPKTEYPQSNSVPLYNAVGSWANDQKSFGFMTPPFQTIKPVTGSNGSSPASQSTQFITYQSRPKRSATHYYIAHNIRLHQQIEKPSTGSDALLTAFPRQSNLYAKPPPADQLLDGNSSLQPCFPILSLSSSQVGGRISANITTLKSKATDSGTDFMSTTQKKQTVNQQAPRGSPVLQLPGPDFIFPVTRHQQQVAATSNQPTPSKSVASTKISSLADNSASVSFNFQRPAASEAPPYLTILPNNGYPFPVASQAALKSGSPANAVPFFNGSFYSSHVSVPSQYQQQQQAHRDTSASNGPSSSHKQPHSQPNTMQKQQLPSTQQSLKLEIKPSGENSSAVSDSWNMHNQKGAYGQISTIPVQPFNFSMSFASLNGGGTSSNFNFSNLGQNPAVVQGNRYHMVATAPQPVQQKNHVVTEPKNVDGKQIATGKTPTVPTGQTLVFDNSARNLNFISTPVTGGWHHRAGTVSTMPSVSSVYSSTPNSQQIQIQKHHLPQQQTQQSVRSKSTATTLPSLTAGGSFNHKQFQQIQQKRTQQGETQISFSGNPKPVALQSQGQQQVLQSQGQQQILRRTQSQQYFAGSPNSTANSTGSNKTGSSAPKTQSQQTDSSSATQKSSPVCCRNVPSIISSSPSQLSELK